MMKHDQFSGRCYPSEWKGRPIWSFLLLMCLMGIIPQASERGQLENNEFHKMLWPYEIAHDFK